MSHSSFVTHGVTNLDISDGSKHSEYLDEASTLLSTIMGQLTILIDSVDDTPTRNALMGAVCLSDLAKGLVIAGLQAVPRHQSPQVDPSPVLAGEDAG